MALVKSSIGVMSGRVGGVVYQRNGRVRRYAAPGNPNTGAQQVARGALIACSAQWQDMDEGTKGSWSAFGSQSPRINRIGDTYRLTGREAFLSLNVGRKKADVDVLTDAPTYGQNLLDVLPEGSALVTAAIGTGSANITVTMTGDWAVAVGHTAAIYVSRARRVGNARKFGGWTLAYRIEGATPSVDDATLLNPFGVGQVGNEYGLLMVIYDNSGFHRREAAVVATVA